MARRSSQDDYDMRFPPYIPAAQRKRDAANAVAKLKNKGHAVEPITIEGRSITSTFWGKAWCAHFESLSDYASRLPRGRSYVRSGAVIHLALDAGRISAKVQGTSLYDVEISVVNLEAQRWNSVVAQCTGSIDSLVELLRGKLSDSVMRAVTNTEIGLFPRAKELSMSCSCPDHAGLCKHLAAVLYGVGARLDARPELLFTLRGVDPQELIAERATSEIRETKSTGKSARRVLSSGGLSDIFGIELDTPGAGVPLPPGAPAKSGSRPKRAASKPSSPKPSSPKPSSPKPSSPKPAKTKRQITAAGDLKREVAKTPRESAKRDLNSRRVNRVRRDQ